MRAGCDVGGEANVTSISADSTPDQEAPSRKWGRIVAIVAGVLVVALGVTAAVVVPRMLHSQRVEEYSALAQDLQLLMEERAAAETTLNAATVLTYVRHSEALSVAGAVAALGDSQEPMIPAAQAELLGSTGAQAAQEIGAVEDVAIPEDGGHEVLTVTYVEAKAAEQQAGAEAGDADQDGATVALPASLGGLEVDQVIELLAAPVVPEPVATVPDEDVTDELIEELRASIASAKKDVATTETLIEAEAARHELLSEAVVSMVPVLHETAAAIDDYLAAVEEQAAKAEEDVAAQTAAAASHVRDSATSDDVAALQGRIASFVAAGEASLTSHAAVVKAEEEAAEAKRKAEEEAAKQRAAEKKKSSSDGWASDGLCNYWAPMGGGMYMAPC